MLNEKLLQLERSIMMLKAKFERVSCQARSTAKRLTPRAQHPAALGDWEDMRLCVLTFLLRCSSSSN
jgi:hypothetical protein